MKGLQHKTISVPNRKKSVSHNIRSPAFRHKYEDGMPRINRKVIEFHNIYDVELPQKVPSASKGFEFWGCVVPKKKQVTSKKSIKPSTSPERTIRTRGETMFRKYIRRRPNLRLTSHSLFNPSTQLTKEQNPRQQTSRQYETARQYQTIRDEGENVENPDKNKFFVTQEQLYEINNKSIYKMSIDELKISIEWKKRFYSYYKEKLESLAESKYATLSNN